MTLLPRITAAEARRTRRTPVDDGTLADAGAWLREIERDGRPAIERLARRFGDLSEGEPWVWTRADLQRACDALRPEHRVVLERTTARIAEFARAQRSCLHDLRAPIAGGEVGHQIVPIAHAGCYAPGGRYPLPSSVLMTAVTARVAGVSSVWLATPKPPPITLAAAAVAGADGLLALGGVPAIAALAFGLGPPAASDIVVGPGNRWVVAAKQLLCGRVAIDALAGPSELVVLADDSADPAWIAADLLAQAEHDPDAWPALVATHAHIARAVERELERQLADLPTAATARAALENGACVLVRDVAEGIAVCDAMAPEHLELMVADAARIAPLVQHAGAVFVGPRSAEVFGDYGAGPNHVLPTGGSARFTGGLSVFTFLRIRSWMELSTPGELAADAAALARLEGLEAHARAAMARGGA